MLINRTLIATGLLALAAAQAPAIVVHGKGSDGRTHIAFLTPESLPRLDFTSHIATVTNGRRLVHIAGQTSVNMQFQVVGDDIAAQTTLALKNLDLALAAANAERKDIVQMMVLFVGTRSSDSAPIREQFRHYFSGRPLPAATYVGVPRLVVDGMLVEVEALAVLPD